MYFNLNSYRLELGCSYKFTKRLRTKSLCELNFICDNKIPARSNLVAVIGAHDTVVGQRWMSIFGKSPQVSWRKMENKAV